MNFRIYMKKKQAKLKTKKIKNCSNLILQTPCQTYAQNMVGKNLDKSFLIVKKQKKIFLMVEKQNKYLMVEKQKKN